MQHSSKSGSDTGSKDDQPIEVTESKTSLQEARNYKNVGNMCFKIGKYDEAIIQYNKAIDICPKENVDDLANFYQNRAAANEYLKKYNDVKADCTKTLELKPKYMKALLRRARILEQTGDLEAAIKDINTVCIHEDFSNSISCLKADVILEKLINQHAQKYLANKEFTIPSKDFITAYIRSFSKDPVFCRLQQPENIPKFLKKPLQALKEKEYDDIIPLCTEVIKSSEFDTLPSIKLEVLLLRATFCALSGDYVAAFQDFESLMVSKDIPDNVKINALIKRAKLYMQLDIPKMAFQNFELAISINPTNSDIYYHRGRVYMHMDNLDEAKRDIAKAVEYNPNFDVAYIHKLYTDYRVALSDRELMKTAEENYEKAFKKYLNPPESVLCHISYAQIMLETQHYQQADAYLVKAMEKDPTNANLYVYKGLLQLQSKDVNKAVEYINKAINLDERCELAYANLGIIELQKGNIEEAIKLFDKALIFCHSYTLLDNVYGMINIAKVIFHIKYLLESIPRFLHLNFLFN